MCVWNVQKLSYRGLLSMAVRMCRYSVDQQHHDGSNPARPANHKPLLLLNNSGQSAWPNWARLRALCGPVLRWVRQRDAIDGEGTAKRGDISVGLCCSHRMRKPSRPDGIGTGLPQK